MLAPEVLEILDSEWVQSPKDKNGKDTWGFELKLSAPDDVKKAFKVYLEAQAAEDELSGIDRNDPDREWLYRQLGEIT